MLTADQTHVARQAFEAHRRKLTVALNQRLERADAKKLRERIGPFEPRLERGADGEYLDVQRRLDWHQWCETWEAALASVGLTS